MHKFIPYGQQWIDEEDIEEVIKVLKSDWITQGPKIKEFEDSIAKFCNCKYAVAVSNGTAALHLACLSIDIGKGDEVITSPLTFMASANCVLYCGGTPVFADIKEDTYNINSEEIRKKITRQTKAIIPVHFAGQPCDMEVINEIAKENDLMIIEDAAHALGSTFKVKQKEYKIGGCDFSDLTILSFHPVKHITTGEGGMILTNNKELYEQLLMLRTHGITKNPELLTKNDGPWYYEMHKLGFNYRITDMQCALGISQFKKLNKYIERRREIVKKYNDKFERFDELIIPYEKNDVRSSYHLYVIQFKLDKLTLSKKEIFEKLSENGVGVQIHYIPVHLQPFYQKNLHYKLGDFPIAEKYYERAMSLPLFPKMSDEDVEIVVNQVMDICKKFKK